MRMRGLHGPAPFSLKEPFREAEPGGPEAEAQPGEHLADSFHAQRLHSTAVGAAYI